MAGKEHVQTDNSQLDVTFRCVLVIGGLPTLKLMGYVINASPREVLINKHLALRYSNINSNIEYCTLHVVLMN